MEEMHRAWYGGRQGASMPALSTQLSTNLHMFNHLEALQTHPSGFSWRLHYTGLIDKIISHWQLIQPPATPQRVTSLRTWLVSLVNSPYP